MSDLEVNPLPEITFASSTEDETRRFGIALGTALAPGDVVALSGNLGAGKTRLVQGICSGLDVTGQVVNSPTFALIQEYAGRIPVYHFDTYRLRSVAEFVELGSDEYLADQGVCLIEWADRVAAVLPRDRLAILIEITGPTSRLFRVTALGLRSAEVVMRLRSSHDCGPLNCNRP